MGFYRLQNEHYFNEERIVDTDVVNDFTCSRQSVITRVVILYLLHDVIHRITVTSYDKHVCNLNYAI